MLAACGGGGGSSEPAPGPEATAAITGEGGDEQGTTVRLTLAVTPVGIRPRLARVPAFLKVDLVVRNELDRGVAVVVRANDSTVGGGRLGPSQSRTFALPGYRPGRLDVRAGDARARVVIERQ